MLKQLRKCRNDVACYNLWHDSPMLAAYIIDCLLFSQKNTGAKKCNAQLRTNEATNIQTSTFPSELFMSILK